MLVKKVVNPKKIFFKYRCIQCKFIIEQPISEAHEVGIPCCSNCGSFLSEYVSTFMLVKNTEQPPKKQRTKSKLPFISRIEYNRTQALLKQENKRG